MSDIELRPICDADQPFLAQLYAATRAEELSVVPWSNEEKQSFLWRQFDAQHTYYQQHFASARFDVILLGGKLIGRLYVDRSEDEIRIIDIALLPDFRRQGIGGRIMRSILSEGRDASKPVRIHVERNNPALHLYRRLGFEVIGDKGVYYFMECRPTPAEQPSSAS